MNTLFDELHGEDSSVINLSVDIIDPFLLSGCKDAFELATMHSMAVCDPSVMFTYGPRQGTDSYRKALAEFLQHQYRDDTVASDNLMVTGESTQALTLICNVFFEKGDTVFVEEPMSPKELSILTALGLIVFPVSLEQDGLDINELDKLLSKVKKDSSKPFSCGLFLTPFYQNPTGTCLSSEKCQQLVEMVNKHSCLCISCDIYQCYSYEKGKAPFGPPPKRLISYEISSESSNRSSGHVVSIGSLSTIFCPGLGMGWLEALPNILDYIKNSPFVCHGGFSQQYLCGVMESALSLGLVKDSFESLRLTFHTRLENLCEAITEKLPQCSFTKPKGGLFVWLTLPSSIDSRELRKLCKEKYQLDFVPGPMCSTKSKFKNNLRLSTSWYGNQTILKGVTQLGEAIKDLQEQQQ